MADKDIEQLLSAIGDAIGETIYQWQIAEGSLDDFNRRSDLLAEISAPISREFKPRKTGASNTFHVTLTVGPA